MVTAQAECIANASGNTVNLRSGPGTDYSVIGSVGASTNAPVNGQAVGLDNFTWYRLDIGGWVREDVSRLEGSCDDLPSVELPPDYCRNAGYADRPVLSGETFIIKTELFSIHYTLEGADATTHEFAQAAAEAMDYSWDYQIDTLGWPAPPPDCSEGGDTTFDVYLVDIAELDALGYAQPNNIVGDNLNTSEAETNAAYGHLVLDNDFADSSDPLAVMRATAAHEFHHNIQLGVNVEAISVLLESGATWMETQVYPDEEAATPYVSDIFRYPDLCIGATPADEGAGNRVYAEWLIVDSIAQDFGIDSNRIIWESVMTGGDLSSYYDGLEALGTTPAEVTQRFAVRAILADFALQKRFVDRPFIEQIVRGVGDYRPARDGVQQLGVDYVYVDDRQNYTFSINQPNLNLILVGIRGNEAHIFELGTEGTVDTSVFDSAVLIIHNTSVHTDPERCSMTNWVLTASAGEGQGTPASDEVWDASNYAPPTVTFGNAVIYQGTIRSFDDVIFYNLFDIEAGDMITVATEATSGNLDTIIHLIRSGDAMDDFIISDDDSGGNLNSIFEYVVEETGDYRLLVTAAVPGGGDYNVFIGVGDGNMELALYGTDSRDADSQPATLSEEGILSLGDLENDGEITYTVPEFDGVLEIIDSFTDELTFMAFLVTLADGDTFYVYAEGLSDSVDTYLLLADSAFEIELGSDDDGGGGLNSLMVVEIGESGQYLLALQNLTETAGDFRLVMGRNAPEVLNNAP